MHARLFAVVLLLAVPLAAAAPPASPLSLPQTDRYVYAEFVFAQPSLSTMELAGELWIYRHDVDGRIYDADDIAAAIGGANKYPSAPTGSAFVAEVEEAVRTTAAATLGAAFPDADVRNTRAVLDSSAVRGPNGNPYDPPIHVWLTAEIVRDREQIGIDGYSDAAVGAVLAAGARVTTGFSLRATEGYHIAYTIEAPASPPGLRFASGPDVSADGGAIVAAVDNTGGAMPLRPALAVLVDPTASAPRAQDIRSHVEVTLGAAAEGVDGIPVAVAVTSNIHALDIGELPGMLPPMVEMSFVDANGLRAMRQAGAIRDEHLALANDALLATIRQDLAAAFGRSVTVTGGISTEDLGQPASAQPVRMLAAADTAYAVPGATPEDVDLALRIGAVVEVDLQLFAANGRATSYVVRAPPGAEFMDAEAGVVSSDRGAVSFSVPDGARSFPASLALRGAGVPRFDAQIATVEVTVDLQDLDVSLGQAAGGDFGDLVMAITVGGSLGVIALPEDVAGSLPPNLDLAYLSADAIRLLLESGHLSEAQLARLEETLVSQVGEKLGMALGGQVPVQGGFDRATLDALLVSEPVSADTPITFTVTARVVKPLAGGEIQPQGAIALYTQEMPLALPKLDDLDTVYTVIMPRGLSVTRVEGAPNDIATAPDGRESFTVTPESESTTVTITMAVTPTFVLVKFWPVVLLAVILLVLIVGTPVALAARRRGKAKKAPLQKPKP